MVVVVLILWISVFVFEWYCVILICVGLILVVVEVIVLGVVFGGIV